MDKIQEKITKELGIQIQAWPSKNRSSENGRHERLHDTDFTRTNLLVFLGTAQLSTG